MVHQRSEGNRKMAAINSTAPGRNRWLIAAAVVSGLGGLVHIVASFSVLPQMHAADMRLEVVAVMDVVWHSVALTLLGSALVLFIAAGKPLWRRPIALALASWFTGGALLVIVLGLYWHGNLIALPQWAPFALVAGLLITGVLRDRV
jgi:hypothetical protein